MAVIESRVAEFGDELRRTRDRLHDVENDRMAVQLLAQQVKNLERMLADRVVDLGQDIADLARRVGELPHSFEAIAKRSAKDAVVETLETRQDSSLRVWANRIAFTVAALALLGVAIQAYVAAVHGP